MNKAHFVTADEQIKPIVYKIYYFTNGEINVPDQRMKSYTTKSKTRKSTHVANYYLLDTSRVENDKVFKSSFGFGLNLCLALVKPLIEARLKVSSLTGSLEISINEMLGKRVSKLATIATTYLI